MIDPGDDLAELLVLWWRAERWTGSPMGYPTECPSTRGYRSSRRGDDDPVTDAMLYRTAVRAISAAVDALQDQQRVAVHLVARNLCSGADVWRSSRLPAPGPELDAICASAFAALRVALGLDKHADTVV